MLGTERVVTPVLSVLVNSVGVGWRGAEVTVVFLLVNSGTVVWDTDVMVLLSMEDVGTMG